MFFYKPDDPGYFVGDIIPFYHEGRYHIFYLLDQNHHMLPGGRHQWAHISTENFMEYKEHPLALPLGKEGECDSASCGTGSIFYENGLFHMFYLGRTFSSHGEKRETICHAVSTDLDSWSKDPDNPVSVPYEGYDRAEWRDPFIYKENGIYYMLITGKKEHSIAGRDGVLAQMMSKDLKSWEKTEDFWMPYEDFQYECPVLFEKNGYHYLFYSVGGNKRKVFYRKKKTGEARWQKPDQDYFDGEYFYAAKPVTDGERIFLAGFIPYRKGNTDRGEWAWGGNLSVLELKQVQNGDFFPIEMEERKKKTVFKNKVLDASEGYAMEDYGVMPADSVIYCSFKASEKTRNMGMYLRCSGDLSSGIHFSVDFVQRWCQIQVISQGEVLSEVKEFCNIESREAEWFIHMEDSVVQILINNCFSLTDRCFIRREGHLFLYAEEGSVQIHTVKRVE